MKKCLLPIFPKCMKNNTLTSVTPPPVWLTSANSDSIRRPVFPAQLLGVLIFACFVLPLWSQETPQSAPSKYALVIGNGSYLNLSRLANPVNDANDIAGVLSELGFSVDKVLNGSLEQMDNAVMRLKNRLSVSDESYGFFFYAGHGVQSGGENFLIPVDANIPGENFLKNRAVSVQLVLDELNDARNKLNIVVLDACRDNPFGWGRSGSRGLAMVSRQPAGSIIVYATSAGQQASDGAGRNGLFTSQLLNHIANPDLEVGEVFKRTGADVSAVSNNQQVPAIYNQFFGSVYLGNADTAGEYVPGSAQPSTQPLPGGRPGTAGTPNAQARLWSAGASVGSGLADPRFIGTVRGTLAPVNNLFFELGLDLGFASGDPDVRYYHVFPYAHAAWYYPFGGSGVYAGAGGGYLAGGYTFPEGESPVRTFAADIVLGVNLFSVVDLSYTFKTNFTNTGHKVSAGYIYRFKRD